DFIMHRVDEIENTTIHTIIKEFLSSNEDDLYKFMTYPAARSVHHDYVSGLIYHTYSMLHLALSIHNIYPNLNKDLLVAGVILHDIGKIKEYTNTTPAEFTLEGKLKGHISIMSEEILIKA